MNDRYRKEYCRDYCGYSKCPYVWLPGLGSFNQGTGFTEDVADEIIAALRHIDDHRRKALRRMTKIDDEMEASRPGYIPAGRDREPDDSRS